MRLLPAVLAFAGLCACGPVQSTASLIDADVAFEAARAAGAAKTATYEYSGAEAYLHKAREAAGRAEYEASANYAERARDLAREARAKAASATDKPEASL
ncbi:DUF4398 domain-containing protein [Anaeromyxobacter terrae]|uniref:DUF4398 domain-containing protein n=1 Tax=Anaeromyxobacter terrae TaxID=2925406 RepID=UPI001F58A118|nr:DUF4398 domain-containing protein [Anaeromyxobacter sp. SG22]